MSITPFRFPPDKFVKHDEVDFREVKNTTTGGSECKQNCNNSIDAKIVLLRDDHIVLLAIDCLLALHASFENWRHRRQTLRLLAELDEHQLRDIGLTRSKTVVRSHLEA
jgi:hypothetical protein